MQLSSARSAYASMSQTWAACCHTRAVPQTRNAVPEGLCRLQGWCQRRWSKRCSGKLQQAAVRVYCTPSPMARTQQVPPCRHRASARSMLSAQSTMWSSLRTTRTHICSSQRMAGPAQVCFVWARGMSTAPRNLSHNHLLHLGAARRVTGEQRVWFCCARATVGHARCIMISRLQRSVSDIV